MKKPIMKIRLDIDESVLKKNLENYKKLAIELRATNARVIKTEEIPVDESICS